MASRFWLIPSTLSAFVFTAVAYLAHVLNYTSRLATVRTNAWGKLFTSPSPSTFCHLISNIVLVRAKKQMFRVLTNRIIAMVENVHIFWDTAISKLPTKAVSRNTLIINTNLPVFTFPGAGLPKPWPTLIYRTFLNITPVPFFRHTIQWVIMSPPAFIMQNTPLTSLPRSFTAYYRTMVLFISHIFNIPQHRGVI